MVRLYENGKPRNEIIREYDLTSLMLGKTAFSFAIFLHFINPYITALFYVFIIMSSK
ncbi:hypothetical protein SYY_02439 [Staphylococcus aureus M0408]|nr:hypothetical protein SYY_02439 [Staphylococcus aureus M0408]CAC5987051.1 transposase [Staphylococcus aureus]